MKILLIAATADEIRPLLESMDRKSEVSNYFLLKSDKEHEISILISGIGIASAVYRLTKILSAEKFDLVVNVGICGSFSEEYEIGTTLNVVSEQFADCGTEDISGFKSIFDIGLIKPDEFPFVSGKLLSNADFETINELKKVNGITVNSVSGIEKTISERKLKFSPDTESMEGAAVFYVCLSEKIPVVQIRTVSNMVEVRNKENWNIKLAVNNLNTVLEKIFFDKRSKAKDKRHKI